MPTIKFSDSQYEALRSVLAYVCDEEKSIQETYELPDNFEEVSSAKKIHMIQKAGATGHIFRDICLLNMVINEQEEEIESDAECECCTDYYHESQIVGSCNDGNCPYTIDNMCKYCGVWDEEKEIWLCPKCQEDEEK